MSSHVALNAKNGKTAFNLVIIVFKLGLCVMVLSNLLTYSYKNEHGWSTLRAI